MKKIAITVLSIALMTMSMTGAFADRINGKTPDQGKYTLYYETGSMSQMVNDKDKLFNSHYQELGALYGFTKNLAAGICITRLYIMDYPSLPDTHVEWWYEGNFPGFLLAEYSFGNIMGIDMKTRLKYNLAKRALIIDRNDPAIKRARAAANAFTQANLPAENPTLTIKDTNLELLMSKAITTQWTVGWSVGVIHSVYDGNEMAKAMKNLNSRDAIRINLGTDYTFSESFMTYFVASQTLNSSAVGTYSEDVIDLIGDNAILRDQYLTLMVGVKTEI